MEDKVEYLLPMVGLNALSERMKASMLEVQNSIVSWPQLASAVTWEEVLRQIFREKFY